MGSFFNILRVKTSSEVRDTKHLGAILIPSEVNIIFS